MIFINVKLRFFQFKFFYEESSLELKLSLFKKNIIDFEHQFVHTFKCTSCGTKTEKEEISLKLCEDCLEVFMESWRKILK